jgi:RNA polymerase sigma-70 factor (ECF subfamily)
MRGGCEDRDMAEEMAPERGGDADVALVASMAAGRSDALAGLYDLHAGAMLGLAVRLLGDRRDAEDLVHDVFLEAWRRAGSYDRGRAPVRSWLLLMVRSRALDRLRTLEVMRRHAQQVRADDTAVASFAPPVGLRGVEHSRALEAIASLPEAQREVVQLSCVEGMSCSEIARRCGLPVGTVKSRLARALASLRDRLGGEGVF